MEWDLPPDADYDSTEIFRNIVDNRFSATKVGSIRGTTYVDSGLGINETYYYWIRFVDRSGNKSGFSDTITGTTAFIDSDQFSAEVMSLFSEAGAYGIEPVATLPLAGDFNGQIKYNTTINKLYRWDSATTSWTDDIFSITAGSVDIASFAAGIEPVGIVSSLPSPTGYTGAKVVFLTVDNKLYRYTGTAWTSEIPAADINGTLAADNFSSALRPVEVVASLPASGNFVGRTAVLTSDGKLYRYTATGWSASVPTTDLSGTISAGQIAANAITAGKIDANAVTTGTIEAGAITTSKIATGAIKADQLDVGSVVSGKIAAGAVSTTELAADSISSDKIKAGAIIADKIAAGQIQTDKIAANAITGGLIAATGIITSAAQINDAVIENAKIANLAVNEAKLANLSVSNAKIQDLSVSTLKIGDNAVTIPVTVSATRYNAQAPAYGTPNFGIITTSIVSTGASKLIQLTYATTFNYNCDYYLLQVRRRINSGVQTVVYQTPQLETYGKTVTNSFLRSITIVDTSATAGTYDYEINVTLGYNNPALMTQVYFDNIVLNCLEVKK